MSKSFIIEIRSRKALSQPIDPLMRLAPQSRAHRISPPPLPNQLPRHNTLTVLGKIKPTRLVNPQYGITNNTLFFVTV